MLTLLLKRFMPEGVEITSPEGREKCGTLCGALGIFLNLVLFGLKLFAGILSASISVTADAFNNLTDAASSIVTIIGFRLAGRKPDPDHPFGHGRIEYISGLVISAVILLTGYELMRSSIDSIMHPEPVESGLIPILILAVSIAVKVYMFAYNRSAGGKIDSAPLKACASDSLNDTVATFIVLAGMIIYRFSGLQIDGWCGIAVSLFIFKGGISSAIETVGDLLGKPPEKKLIDSIEEIVLSQKDIHAMHDLIVHDYGAGRLMITLHAEVPADGDVLELHDEIDNAERELQERLGCFATIHLDPVLTHKGEVAEAYARVRELVEKTDPVLQMHDFRMVEGPTHTNVIFDVVVPFDYPLSDTALRDKLCAAVKEIDDTWFAVIQIDKSFVGARSNRAHNDRK